MSKQSNKKYRQANSEKVKKQIAEWRKKNPGKAKEYSARRYARHSARLLAEARAFRAANPELSRRYTRRSRYKRNGINLADAERVRAAHNGRCDCCGRDKSGGNGWAVDHDHSTGRVRGVLCNWCNIAIGRLGDTLEGVLKAVRYLEKGDSNG